ncbi:glucan biosynthesis protein G [Labrenzia sp. 011]|uniref:glucan biosynthesis protein n=1 Tax=Labrenzia sp. 011 TaxID=2171494 RepID=UPI000D50960A|nr:glucan biosynthesis protein G [Labrenzia sp. 011]PVB61677.1 glucan biosynthesis protein D [Labrenzia sp. 011]
MINRRKFLSATALMAGSLAGGAVPGVALAENSAPAQSGTGSSPAAPFSFETLINRMKDKAENAFDPATPDLPDILADLDYDQHRSIRFLPERSVWADIPGNYRLQAFHPGWLYDEPVELFEIAGNEIRPIRFTGADFEYRAPLDPEAFKTVELPGIAGFRLHHPLNTPDFYDELIVFLGASYFRALGKGNVYGLSARGLAIDTAIAGPEEFPRFTRFYLERPAEGAVEMRLYAELESSSVAGAYQFTIKPGVNTVVEVDARIFLREDVDRLGIAPLTSMFLFGENDRTGFDDYRPEVHDNDGLLILRHDGQRLWRPIRNPEALSLSFFKEESPAGFGLLQRDRDFDNYQDTEAKYQRRPSLWIEPVNGWGRGHVMLAEIPADKEIYDNIVAFWVPEGGTKAGSEHRFAYRMIWGSNPEPGTELAQIVRTSTGHGGAAASDPDPKFRKFVVEFAGEALSGLGADAPLEPRLTIQNAEVKHHFVQRLEGGSWRVVLDVERKDAGTPVEFVLALQLDGTDRTETWMYQWSGDS